MGRWQYTKKKTYAKPNYLYLENGKPKTFTITGWVFNTSGVGPYFSADVVTEDGEKSSKLWTVWNYDLNNLLKKKLKGKNSFKKLTIEVTRTEENMEESFELKLKK